MNRFDVIEVPAPYPTTAIVINKYADAARIARASGESVPKRSEFGSGWGMSLCGPVAVEAATDRLERSADFPGTGFVQSFRARRLAAALGEVIVK